MRVADAEDCVWIVVGLEEDADTDADDREVDADVGVLVELKLPVSGAGLKAGAEGGAAFCTASGALKRDAGDRLVLFLPALELPCSL